MKMILSIIRYIPIILTFIYTICSGLNLFGITTSIMVYLLPLTIILIPISYKYNYCYLHKMSIYYLVIIGFLNLIDFPETVMLYIDAIGLAVGGTLFPMIILQYKDMISNIKRVKYIKELLSGYIVKDYVKNNKDNITKIYRRY